MAFNPGMMFKIKGAWERFIQNHPKFPMFLRAAAATGIKEEGKTICTNVKLTDSDMDLIDVIKDMSTNGR